MKNKNKKFYISTAIDYVNSFPHAGHALEKIQADVLARYHRVLGEEVFFLTGTDENGLKIARAAEQAGIPVEKFAEKNANTFRQLKEILNLSFDDFIRTTEERHVRAVHKLWELCKKDIYKKKYQGLYCVGCEQFYKDEELVDGFCPEHKTKPEFVEEENYFFKLSKYENQLKELIEKDIFKIIPETRKNEALGFIKKGLEDICISRSVKRARGWGIDVLDDSEQKVWCWFEAVINYISALGYGSDDLVFQEWWQDNDNKLHVIGKGILTFHALYWPAVLLSAGLALPNKLFVHGYVTAEGQKMSKSLGNVVTPEKLVEKYGIDAVRYYFLREALPFSDLDFSYKKFEERYNADLANGLGNLVARTIKLAQIFNFSLPLSQSAGFNQFSNSNFQTTINKNEKNYHEALEEFKFNEALQAIWQLIGFCDKYIEEKRPWEKKEDSQAVVQDVLLALQEIARLLAPLLPQTSEKILEQIKGGKIEPIFPRVE